jgi:tripartite-type tricarboxylate transporter receptor subunit TctC
MLDFQKRAGIDMTYVPYRSTATALTDVAAGRIHLLTTSLTLAFPLVQEGTIKLLAVTTPERSKTVPDTPTASEAGHPELTVEAPLGLFGPKSISPDLRARIAGRKTQSLFSVWKELGWSSALARPLLTSPCSISNVPAGRKLRGLTGCALSNDQSIR